MPSPHETNLKGWGGAAMVSLRELDKIEMVLRQGRDARACVAYIGKLRGWLAAGGCPADVRRKLEQMVSRFGNSRFASAPRQP